MPNVKGISILGATGSIGRNTCRVLEGMEDRFRVVSLAAGGNLDLLLEQVTQFHPKIVSLRDKEKEPELQTRLKKAGYTEPLKIVSGTAGMVEAATDTDVDLVVSAAHGVTGLEATYRAIEAGKDVALANKETLVVAGSLVTRLAQKTGSEILPVDSEHNAIHQCLRAGRREEVRSIILTASGGPFRKTPGEQMDAIQPEEALQHPTWKMGGRITVDSATLMNKGFEIIEACWLFGLPPEAIEVVIHPQSVVHSMVEFHDGSVMAQMGVTDMQLPIRYALTYPERLPENGVSGSLSWREIKRFDFEPPDTGRFPCLDLARQALEAGESMPCALNAADEVAVEAFLERKLKFTDIPRMVERVLQGSPVRPSNTLNDVWEQDREARERARQYLQMEFT